MKKRRFSLKPLTKKLMPHMLKPHLRKTNSSDSAVQIKTMKIKFQQEEELEEAEVAVVELLQQDQRSKSMPWAMMMISHLCENLSKIN